MKKKIIRLTENQLKNIIRKKLFEQDEEKVVLSPEEYLQLLSFVGYNAKILEKTKRFKGKRIYINGNLFISGNKQIKNLGSIYINGNLNATDSGLETLDGVTVTGYKSLYWTPLNDKIIARKRREELKEANERRKNKEWDLDNPDIDELGEKANAAFKLFTIDIGIDPLSDEEKNELEELENRYSELEDRIEVEDDEDLIDELNEQLSEIQEEMDELQRRNIDVYGMIPAGGNYNMDTFKGRYDDYDDFEIAVGTVEEADESLWGYMESLLDDIGYHGFGRSTVEDNIDGDEVADYFEDSFREQVYEDPQNFDIERELSKSQKEEIWLLKMEMWVYEKYGVRAPILYPTMEDQGKTFDFMDNDDNRFHLKNDGAKWTLYKEGSVVLPFQVYDDEDTDEHQDDRESRISDIEYEIESIEEEPDGDLDEDSIERAVEKLKDDVRDNPMSYLSDYGLDPDPFINRDDFIQSLVDDADYGRISGYSDFYDEYTINGTKYVVIWVDK